MNLPITDSTQDSSGGGPLTHGQTKGCCAPAREAPLPDVANEGPAHYSGLTGQESHHSIDIPAGIFSMGDALGEGYPEDGETPVHRVELDGFRIDATTVTNTMFAAFIHATGYRTEAEQYGSP